MGGGSSKSGSAQKWAKPFAKEAAASTQDVFNQNQPGLNSLTDQVQGLVPGLIAKYNAGDPALNASENYTTSMLGRDPYAGSTQLDNLINTTNANVRDQVGASFGSRGSFGGTAWETALAKGLAQNEAGLRYGDVQNNQQLQAQAAGLAPQQAAAQYLGISPVIQAATAGSQIPYTGINALDSGLAALFSGGKTTGPSPLAQALGAGAQAAGAYFGAKG